MPFEQVELVLPDGRTHGPIDWPTLFSWVQQNRVPAGAKLIDVSTREERAVMAFPDLAAAMPQGDDAVSVIIPYKNAPALLAYYLGIFSLIACIPLLGFIGVIMGFSALVLGIKGLKQAKANPQAHGRVHAWIGIICGPICAIVGLVINVAMIIGLLANR